MAWMLAGQRRRWSLVGVLGGVAQVGVVFRFPFFVRKGCLKLPLEGPGSMGFFSRHCWLKWLHLCGLLYRIGILHRITCMNTRVKHFNCPLIVQYPQHSNCRLRDLSETSAVPSYTTVVDLRLALTIPLGTAVVVAGGKRG